MTEINKALTWDELATEYDKIHRGRPARALPMQYIFNWAEKQIDTFIVSEKGTIHYVIKTNEKENNL